jgi:hypothetical protein
MTAAAQIEDLLEQRLEIGATPEIACRAPRNC